MRSRDLGAEEEFASLDALLSARRYKLPLAAYMLRYFRPSTGPRYFHSFGSAGGGGHLGLLHPDHRPRGRVQPTHRAGHKLEQMRVICQNIEAQIIRVPTGCQDYYPAMYGGVSAIELTEAGISAKRLPLTWKI